MRNQMKFYLALLAVILLQGSIYSISIKESESLKLNLETDTKTPNLEDPHHELSDDQQDACDNEKQTLNKVLCANPPGDLPTPIDPTGCKKDDQELDEKWSKMENCQKEFKDVGVSSEGAIVAIGTNGKLYLYDYDLDTFELLEGDYDLNNLRRVDIAYDSRIYVVNYSGDTYYLDCKRHWVKLPGCAIDIGAGRGSEIVKIGCNDYCGGSTGQFPCDPEEASADNCPIQKDSPYVYKLICDCDCRCCHRKCNIFAITSFEFCNCKNCEKDVDRKCYWVKYPNGPCYETTVNTVKIYNLCKFSRIDAHLSGHPMVIGECQPSGNTRYRLWQFMGDDINVFKEMVTSSKKFRDLCGDNLGNIFYLQNLTTSSTSLAGVFIYKLDGTDVQLDNTNFNSAGTAVVPGYNISCGPYAQPTMTDAACCLWTTSKVGYN